MIFNIIFCGIASFFAGLYFGRVKKLNIALHRAEKSAEKSTKVFKEFEDFLNYNGTYINKNHNEKN